MPLTECTRVDEIEANRRYHGRMHKLICAFAAGITLLAAGPTAATADSTRPLVMTDLRGGSRAGVDVTFGSVGSGPGDVTVIGVEGLVELELTRRLSLTGALPLVHARDGGTDYDGSSLGNITVGLAYRLSVERRGDSLRAVGIGGSLSLPTASDGGDAAIAAFAHSLFHLPDPGRFLPDTTTIRIHGDYRYQSGKIFLQGQLGLHQLVIDGPDDLTLVRIAFGGGARLSNTASAVFTLTTMSDILDDSDGEDFVHQLDLGARFKVRRGEVGARIFLGLDDSTDHFGVGVDYLQYF